MDDDSVTHHRRSIRLPEYDYSQAGGYFVTIVTKGRLCIFGNVVNGNVELKDYGVVAQNEWLKAAQIRQNVKINDDEFVVMPNHIHGIIWIKDNVPNLVEAQRRCAPTPDKRISLCGQILGTIVRAYKSAVTYQIHKLGELLGLPIWQRNYYEHIIRNDRDYANIYDYIQVNPINWESDEENIP